MAKRQQMICLEASRAEALTACRHALMRLGWEVSDKAESCIVGEEEPWRLACRYTPSRIEVELRPESSARTNVLVAVSAPGFGPLTSRRLERQIAAFEEKATGGLG